ncbi:hypothetical protein ACTD5D_40410 [Nocardia takedensis]|uniref:hypothetical protein n=1 Tax=Nocardia takedensis TaxID=259390 RepID=UPI003F75E178
MARVSQVERALIGKLVMSASDEQLREVLEGRAESVMPNDLAAVEIAWTATAAVGDLDTL